MAEPMEARLAQVLEELAALRAENAHLAAKVEGLATNTGTAANGDGEQGVYSRRHLLRLGGAGAAGAGLAIGAAVLGARPAAAGTDGDLALGQNFEVNNAGASRTGIGSTSHGATLYAFNDSTEADGIGLEGTGATGVHGSSFPGSTSPGVIGTTPGAFNAGGSPVPASGVGVKGEVVTSGGPTPLATTSGLVGTNEGLGTGVLATSALGVGVSAQGGQAPLRLVPSASVVGPPTTGDHVQGELFVDKNGVLWLCTVANTPGTWVRAITSGLDSLNTTGAALQVNQVGTGSAMIGNVTNAASAAIGVYGQSNGSGQAVKGYNNGTGMAVYGQVNNAANASPAMQGYTNGKGPGVEGNQVGVGYGVLGNIANASNSSAAVRGVTNGTGPALQGAGGRAQLNLVPGGSSLPPSPQSGDFFVDNLGSLHYRKGGTWVNLTP